MTTVQIASALALVDCISCAFEYAVPARFDARRQEDHGMFYCPSCGKGQHYTGKSEADKLREQLEAKQRRLESAEARITHLRDQNDATERALRAQRGANTKLRKRVSNGVCPCCSRTFADLARHMSGQHPDYVAEAKTETVEVGSHG